MKLNKVLFILFFPFIAQVVVSCCDCPDPYDDRPIIRYESDVSEVSFWLVNNELDEKRLLIPDEEIDTVKKEAFGIEMYVTQVFSRLNRKPKNSFFINSAYATSCDCDYLESIDLYNAVSDFKIRTLTDFDPLHTNGSDITAYFRLFENGSYIKIEPNFEVRGVSTFLLLEPPVNNGIYQFELSFTLADGSKIIENTPEIYLD